MSIQSRGTFESLDRRLSRCRAASLLLVFLPALVWCGPAAVLDQPKDRVLRIAVIPVNPTAESLAAAVMVQATLDTHPNCETIEREQIGAVLQEKALSGDLARQAVDTLSETLQADGFLFFEMVLHGERKLLHLTAVEAQYGALLMSRLLATDSEDALGRGIRDAVAEGLRRMRAPAAEKRFVGWLGVSPGATGETWLRASRTLAALVEMHLSELPGVAMLDRRRLQRVGEEAFISGLDQTLRRSVILLDAQMRPSGVGGQLELNLRARWPASGTATNLQVRTHLDELEQGAQDLTAGTASLLALPLPAVAMPVRPADEISLLAHRTEALLASRSWTEALESAEALAAFSPTQQTYRVMLFRALDAVSAGMRARLGQSAEVDEGIMLDLMLRAVEVRTRHIEDMHGTPPVSGSWIFHPFETDYRYRPARPSDSQEVRQKLHALAEAEERMFRAQVATGERYLNDHGYPFLLLRALRRRANQVTLYQSDNPAAQIAVLRQAVDAFKRTRTLDIRPPQVAVELLFETVSHEMCRHFGSDPRRSRLFRDYLAELASDSNAWCRLTAGRGAYSARYEEQPHLVPDSLPDNQELKRRAARIVRYEILPDLLSESPPRLKYKQETRTQYNSMLEIGLLLDWIPPKFTQYTVPRNIKDDLPSDPVRLSELAAILEMTDKLDWTKHTFILYESTRRAIRHALVVTGQKAAPTPQRSEASPPTAAQPADSPPNAGKKPFPWDAYRVMRAGPGYRRQHGWIARSRRGDEPYARDSDWLFLQPDGDILHVADVQGWRDATQTLTLRLMRLQLPACAVVEDRTISLECPVPDVLTREVNGFAWGGGHYFLATPRGLLIVDGQTFATKRLTTEEGLPCNQVAAVAWFDDALFLSTHVDARGSAASLLRMDLATGVFEELAAERTAHRRTPLDGWQFEVTDMFPDPAQGRLLLRIKWKSATRLEIWEWRPATKSLICIQDNQSGQPVLWLPSSRHHAQVGGAVTAFMPSSDTLVGIPGADYAERIACEDDTVFFLEPWGRTEEPRAVHLVRKGSAASRCAQTDDGYPMTYLVALAATDAGLVLLNIFGETFLVRRRDRLEAWTEWDLEPIQGGPAERDLLRAAFSGDATALRQALSRGAKTEVNCRACATPLTLAIQRHEREIAHMLIDAGADIEYASLQGDTPLMSAAICNDIEILERLLKAKATPNCPRPSDGVTPLLAAALKNSVAAARLLLAAGAHCDARFEPDGLRATPLMYAVRTNDTTLAKLLIAHGANVQNRDSQGRGVLDYAIKAGSTAAIELLRDAGAVK